jgi:hypothetical protein
MIKEGDQEIGGKSSLLVLSIFHALGAVILKADGWLGFVLSLIFSLGAVMIYTIFYQSRLNPRWLSAWGLIGAVLSPRVLGVKVQKEN